MPHARPATIRAQLICIAARIAHRAQKTIPCDWPWRPAWQQLFAAVHTTPANGHTASLVVVGEDVFRAAGTGAHHRPLRTPACPPHKRQDPI